MLMAHSPRALNPTEMQSLRFGGTLREAVCPWSSTQVGDVMRRLPAAKTLAAALPYRLRLMKYSYLSFHMRDGTVAPNDYLHLSDRTMWYSTVLILYGTSTHYSRDVCGWQRPAAFRPPPPPLSPVSKLVLCPWHLMIIPNSHNSQANMGHVRNLPL